jgi:hypothetical protein
MKLASFMTENSLGPADMAARVGDASASGVLKWMRGERTPRPEQMRRIFEVTEGAVSPNDFVLGDEAGQGAQPEGLVA